MPLSDVETVPAERCGMAWTEEETAILVDLLDQGGSPADAFGLIGRGEDAIKRKWRKIVAHRSNGSKKLESTSLHGSAASKRNRQVGRELAQSLIGSHNDDEADEANEWEVLGDSVSEGDDGAYLPTWSSAAGQLRRLHKSTSASVPMPGAACEDCRRKHKRCDHRAMSISTPSKSTTTSHLTHGELDHSDRIVGQGIRSCRQGTVRVPSPERVDLFRSVQSTADSAAPRKMTTVSHKCISSDEVTVLQAISEAAMNEVHPISQQGSQMQSSTGVKKRGRPRKVRLSDHCDSQIHDSQTHDFLRSDKTINFPMSQMHDPFQLRNSDNVQQHKTCSSYMGKYTEAKVTKSSKVKSKKITITPPQKESATFYKGGKLVTPQDLARTPEEALAPSKETSNSKGKRSNRHVQQARQSQAGPSRGQGPDLDENMDSQDDHESMDDSRSSSPFEWTNVRPREPQLQAWSEDTPPLIPPCPPHGPIWSINRPYSSVRDEPLPPAPENDPSKYYLPRPRGVPAAEDKQALDSPADREERDTMSEHQ